jgi:hypothetical protein
MSESVLSRVLNLLSYAERSGHHPDTVVMSAADEQAMSDEMTDNPFREGITIVVDDGCPDGHLAVLDSTQCVGVNVGVNGMAEAAESVAQDDDELTQLRAQVDELLPWAIYGARKVGEFGDDVVGTIEIVNGKVRPLIRPGANDLIRRIHTGEFWGDA